MIIPWPMKALDFRFHTLLAFLTLLATSLPGFAQIEKAAPATKPWYVISDLDDTIKLTGFAYVTEGVWRTLLSRKAFAGMSPLYQELSGPDTVYISSGMNFLSCFAKSFLEANDFPGDREILMRTSFESRQGFKLREHARIFAERTGRLAILMGDDGEQDPETFQILLQEHPEQIAAAYIHRINGRGALDGELPYDTAYDVALYEFMAGRMSSEQAQHIGESVLGIEDDDEIMMPWAFCPVHGEDLTSARFKNLSPELSALQEALSDRIVRICTQREDGKSQPPATPGS